MDASLDRAAGDLHGSALVLGCGGSVTRTGNTIVVAPNAADDTANLQCALDAAASSAAPMTVKLMAGTFHTAPLVATGFHGALRGAGEDASVLTNVSRSVSTSDIPNTAPITPGNPWPALIAFVGGNFTVSDLTIEATGTPTTGWNFFGAPFAAACAGRPRGCAFEANVVVLPGETSTHASFTRVTFKTARDTTDPSKPVYSSLIGLLYSGSAGVDIPSISGTLEVRQSTFVDWLVGTYALNLRDATADIVGNRFEGVETGGILADVENTTYTFAADDLSGYTPEQTNSGATVAVLMYDVCQGSIAPGVGSKAVCGMNASRIGVAANKARGFFDGVDILSTFGAGTRCAVVANDLAPDTANGGIAVWLGPGTHDCLVAASGPVRDQGTNNRVVPGR